MAGILAGATFGVAKKAYICSVRVVGDNCDNDGTVDDVIAGKRASSLCHFKGKVEQNYFWASLISLMYIKQKPVKFLRNIVFRCVPGKRT